MHTGNSPGRKDFAAKEPDFLGIYSYQTDGDISNTTSCAFKKSKSVLCPWKPEGWLLWGRFWAGDPDAPNSPQNSRFPEHPCRKRFIPVRLRQLAFCGAGCKQLLSEGMRCSASPLVLSFLRIFPQMGLCKEEK